MLIVLELFVPLAALSLFALLAVRFGHDSRDGVENPPEPPLGSPIVEAWRARRPAGVAAPRGRGGQP
ncbi:MAG TPA: hypothetical protein VFU81_10400 [Thermomicrobiales bacterium]|nr:hypothetical protein [Thermomicrobiales bacterium]